MIDITIRTENLLVKIVAKMLIPGVLNTMYHIL